MTRILHIVALLAGLWWYAKDADAQQCGGMGQPVCPPPPQPCGNMGQPACPPSSPCGNMGQLPCASGPDTESGQACYMANQCDPSNVLETECLDEGGIWNAYNCTCGGICNESGANTCEQEGGTWEPASCECLPPVYSACNDSLTYTYTQFITEGCEDGEEYMCTDSYENINTVDCYGNIISSTSVELGESCQFDGQECFVEQ